MRGLSILLIISLVGICRGDCFTKGSCEQSHLLDATQVTDEFDCLRFCQDEVQGCQWITYFFDNQLCEAFANCVDVDPDTDSIHGEANCESGSENCWFQGRCLGVLNNLEIDSTREDCLTSCQTSEGCHWFTFDDEEATCSLLADCPEVDTSCETCISGEESCPYQDSSLVLMLSGNYDFPYSSARVELDLALDNDACRVPPSFPKDVTGAIGLLYQGEPLICGGHNPNNFEIFYSSCYRMNANKTDWDYLEMRFSTSRGWSAGDYLDSGKKKYWVTGGQNSWMSATESTEYFEDGDWSRGPIMARELADHCHVQINETHTLLAGGMMSINDEYNHNIYIYNWDTELWHTVRYTSDEFGVHRRLICTMLDNGKVLMAGGFSPEAAEDYLTEAWYFDPVTETLESAPEMPMGRHGGSAIKYKGEIYLVSGSSATILVFNQEREEWRTFERSGSSRAAPAIAIPHDVMGC